jgi:ribosomal protein L37AE/L43A
MNTTKDQCTECGDFSTVRHSDGSYECLNCRHISYESDSYLSFLWAECPEPEWVIPDPASAQTPAQ